MSLTLALSVTVSAYDPQPGLLFVTSGRIHFATSGRIHFAFMNIATEMGAWTYKGRVLLLQQIQIPGSSTFPHDGAAAAAAAPSTNHL